MCFFFRALRDLLRPIVAGIFELNERMAMNFEQYFAAVDEILNMDTLKVFHHESSVNHILYLRKTAW